MLYASAKNLLKQSLSGVTFVVEGQQLSDLQYEDVSLKESADVNVIRFGSLISFAQIVARCLEKFRWRTYRYPYALNAYCANKSVVIEFYLELKQNDFGLAALDKLMEVFVVHTKEIYFRFFHIQYRKALNGRKHINN